jgi:hypothetical protein
LQSGIVIGAAPNGVDMDIGQIPQENHIHRVFQEISIIFWYQ